MMAWRRDPPAARLIQALPIVTGRPRRTRTNTPTTPDIRPPTTDFADPLGQVVMGGRAGRPPASVLLSAWSMSVRRCREVWDR